MCGLLLYGLNKQIGQRDWAVLRSSGRQSNWATDNWATHFGQLGDNIGRVIKDVNVGKKNHKLLIVVLVYS